LKVLTIAAFPSTPLSLGLVCDFVSRFPPFDTFEFRQMTVTLRFQLEQQSHLVAGRDDEIVGYLGWIPTTAAIAEAWVIDEGPLVAATEEVSAIAVTVLVTSNPSDALPLLRKAKATAPGLPVYWKRQFVDGKEPRKRSVRKKSDDAPS
jgi:hypothetical protein